MKDKLWILHKPTGQRFCLFEKNVIGDIEIAQRADNLLAFLDNLNEHDGVIRLDDFVLTTRPLKEKAA